MGCKKNIAENRKFYKNRKVEVKKNKFNVKKIKIMAITYKAVCGEGL